MKNMKGIFIAILVYLSAFTFGTLLSMFTN